ncbi:MULTISPECIES: hypothetical protein [Altibacter]|uniref:hypothetical protein n=1 Tax=Altibacter TaxID=1535231 RepID=UPI000551666F|nr:MULTISPECIES: hypothetical protein [Altibacter]MCW8980239.1 hypothetical protein [Altibacter sp.]MCW9037736.1 hypothetical protein [Altibacter sp.]
MRKTYRYRDLSYPVEDSTEVFLTVTYISDGNLGKTLVYQPHLGNPEIENSGTVSIGTGAQLRGRITICLTEIANLNPNEDEISLSFSLNDTPLVAHHNDKSEENNPTIVLFIRFPKP